ncbi:protein anachronism isoform X2 [Drosophila busckii]|uniref:protein anachronism isoform X2 n=1 Tax=Drosophila busckii TaxID=30019 RepID=UPI00083F4D5C|nr:protein anachronism isoform X2 [Drosophila busckii]
MLSAVSLEGCGRRCLLLLLCMQLLMSCSAGRINRSAFMDGDIHSEVIDPNNRTILDRFNLTEAQLLRIRNETSLADKNRTNQAVDNHFQRLHHWRAHEVQENVRNAIRHNTNAFVGDEPVHGIAGYPMCNGETSIHNWQQSKNLTLQFAKSVFEQHAQGSRIESALLRLYKINPNAPAAMEQQPTATSTPLCNEATLESQIRITVSIVHQQKRKRKSERKKRICNTMMVNSSTVGWVAIDVRCALNFWTQQQPQQQQQQQQQAAAAGVHAPTVVGLLMVELHDDEDNQLLPGQHFMPPTCEEAVPPVPWTIPGSEALVLSLENKTMPKLPIPRLDVVSRGNGRLALSNFEDTNVVLQSSTTANSPTIDNNLELSENNSNNNKEHHHHHSNQYHHHHHENHHNHQKHHRRHVRVEE